MRQLLKSAFVLIVALFVCREVRAETATKTISHLGGEVSWQERTLWNEGIIYPGMPLDHVRPQNHAIVLTTEEADKWYMVYAGIRYFEIPSWIEDYEINVNYIEPQSMLYGEGTTNLGGTFKSHPMARNPEPSSVISFTRTLNRPVTANGKFHVRRNFGEKERIFSVALVDNAWAPEGDYESLEAVTKQQHMYFIIRQEGCGFKLDYVQTAHGECAVSGMHTGEGDAIDEYAVLSIPDGPIFVNFDNPWGTTKTIADNAFVNCEFPATKVVLPRQLEKIGTCAFSGCTSITNLDFTDSGKIRLDIGDYAFDGCTGLTSVHFPACVNKVGKGAFAHCSNLREFTVDDANSMSLSVCNGCLCDKLGLTLLACPATFTSVTIPSSITSIQYGAFMGCDNLTEVTTEPGREDWVAEQMLAAGFNTDQVLFNGKHYDADLCEVIFELGWEAGARRVGGGELVQYVKRGGSAVEPILATEEGWNADGWCSKLENIQEDYTPIKIWCYSDEESLTTANGIIWRYTADENGATIHGGKDVAGRRQFDMDIPSELDGYKVTAIGDWAFEDCSELTSVTIPAGMTSIGDYAFSGCHGLTSMEIPSCVTSIGELAFSWCSRLLSITIPHGVTSIGSQAFHGCHGLTSVAIPSSVTSIGLPAFSFCNGLKSLLVDSSNPIYCSKNGLICSKDGETVIAGVNGNVVVPEGVTSIGEYAFFNCEGLMSVVMPGSVTNIGNYAFEACHALKSVCFTGDMPVVNEKVYDDSENLTTYVREGASGWGEVPGEWCGRPIEWWNIYPEVYGVEKSIEVDGRTWRYCLKKDGAEILGCDDATGDLVIPSELDGHKVTAIGDWAFSDYNDGLTSVTIPEGVTSIGDVAFRSCYGLTSLTIPESVTNVGEAAFIYCDGLKSMTIPSGVTSIGEDAFMGCSKMEVFSVDQANTAYCSQNGLLCSKDGKTLIAGVIGDVIIPEGVVTIANDAFMYLYGLTSVALPSSLSSIGADAFWECGQLQSLVIPEGVTNIGYGAFASCRSLRSVCFAGDVPVVDETVYDYSENLATYVREGTSGWGEVPGEWCGRPIEWWSDYPDVPVQKWTVTFDLGEHGTRTGGGELVQEVADGGAAVAPEVQALEGYEFYGWDAEFGNVTGPMTVYARYAKEGLLPDGDGYTEDVNGYLWAFSIVNGEAVIEPGISPEPIGELVIPSELGGCLVTTIAESAFDNDFADMSGLTSVTIPAGVIAIGDYAFWGCSALQTVIYEGDEDEIDFGHSVFEDTPYERNQPFSLIMDGTIVTGFKGAIPQSLVIPDGVTEIGDGAFEYCEGLRSVVIPESVTYIGDYAFADCDGLRSVSFIGGMPEISCSIYGEEDCVTTYVREGTSGWDEVPGEWCGRPIEWWKTYPDVYDEEKTVEVDGRTWRYCLQKDGAEILGCDDVSGDLVIPAGLGGHKVTAIGGRSFEHCDELTSVTIPEGVTSIGEGAFCECNGLTEVVIPPGVESIGDYAFVSCYRLTSVAIPEGVTSIGDYAFEWCVCLRSVALPSSLTTIGEYAFYYCPDMRTITIPPSVISIGEGAFCDCEALKAVLFSGDRPEVGDAIYDGANSATTYVREGTSGWGEVPGEWCGRPVEWWTTFPDVPVDETVEDGVYVVSKDGYDWTVTVEYGEVWIGDRTAWSYSEAAISPQPRGALEIPEEFFGLPVVGLSDSAFMYCSEMTSVRIPKHMRSISAWTFAFIGCSALAAISVDAENASYKSEDGFLLKREWGGLALAVGKTGPCAVPDGVVSVYPEAFSLCPEMTALSLPESVVDFSVSAVDDCAALLSITVAEGNPNFRSANGVLLSKDGTTLVAWPCGIADGVVPNGVTNIGKDGGWGDGSLVSPFPGGSKMRSIAIPASVNRIADGAFSSCESLTEITVDSGNAVYTAANGLLMTADGRTLLACAGGCIDVVIPDGVTEIGGWAFVNNSLMGNYSLRSVTVPSSVCHIEAGAFSCCYYLTSVCFAGAAPEVDDSDGWTYDLYEGSEYVTTYVQLGAQGWGVVPGTWHERPIKWWTMDNPSPIPELEDDADVNQVYMALYGSTDDKLVDNILMTCLTEGDVAGADLYNNYRLWAGRARDEKGDPLGLQAVRNSPTAWTSFALDQTTLLERNLTDEDLKIEEFKPSMDAGTFDFTVSIKDVEVGPLAMAENLKKTFGLEGATELVPSAFGEANVDIEFGMPEDGKLKFTAEPLDKDAKSFFMKMSVK